MSIDLVAFGVILLVSTLCAVELSVCIGVFGYGCPILTSVVWMGTVNFSLVKSASNSGSATELITALMICEILRMASLFHGMSSLLDMHCQ